jgi:peptidoglycan-N-acetylmuramic acid deacetylase
MNFRFIRSLIIIAVFVPLLSGCGSREAYNARLSDLGGVYASREADLDLRVEVSGRLSEGVSSSIREDAAEVVEGEGGVLSNKLLRWGISRRDNHQTPAADPGAPELLSKYGGAYIGDVSVPTIYLTFDEGYENGYTPLILDTLRDNRIRAVFFITGPYLSVHQDLVRRMVEEGHAVGNHTIHHPSLPEVSDSQLEEEILGLDRAFNDKFGQHMKFLRPPKGEYSERTLAMTRKLGYCNLFWSFAYDDWYRDRIRGPEYAHSIVMRNLHNGAVLLLHAVSKDNAQALGMIIKDAQEMGYAFGDPDELLPREEEESD